MSGPTSDQSAHRGIGLVRFCGIFMLTAANLSTTKASGAATRWRVLHPALLDVEACVIPDSVSRP